MIQISMDGKTSISCHFPMEMPVVSRERNTEKFCLFPATRPPCVTHSHLSYLYAPLERCAKHWRSIYVQYPSHSHDSVYLGLRDAVQRGITFYRHQKTVDTMGSDNVQQISSVQPQDQGT